jgi:REP element-mobilizing transposase RayT
VELGYFRNPILDFLGLNGGWPNLSRFETTVAPPLSLPVLERQGGITISYMASKPRRYQHQRCLHFITFSCYQRRKLLDFPAAREIFEDELERVRCWYGCYLSGYVVMPEHVHLLISEPDRTDLSVVMQMLKQITAHKLRPLDLPAFLADPLLRFSGVE